jgi:outer membrane cobalamin receptor
MFRNFGFLLLVVAVSGTSVARAEDATEMSLEDLLGVEIQVASGGGDSVFTSPSTVTVIDRQMIERYNFQSVAEAIETLSGIAVNRTYFKRQIVNSRGYLQDHYQNRVMIMINGIALFHPGTGEGNIDRVGIDNVDRIEVLKGPASVIYGSNAYSGAVNIITRHERKGGHGTALIAERGTFGSSAHISDVDEKSKIFVAGAAQFGSGHENKFYDEQNSTGFHQDKLNEGNFTGRYQRGGHTLTANGARGEEGYMGSLLRNREAEYPHEVEGYMVHYGFEGKINEKLTYRVGALYDYQWRRLFRTPTSTATSVTMNISDVYGHREQLTSRLDYRASENLNFKGGVEWEKRQNDRYNTYNQDTKVLAEENEMNNKQVRETSAFAEADYKMNDLRFLLGSRYTDNEQFGGNVSSRAAAVYSLTQKQAVKFVYGQAYRSPSIFELYFLPNTPTVQGTADLEPEKSDNFELTYLAQIRNFYFQVTGYRAKYKNKISRLPTATAGQTKYANVGDFEATGFEFESRADFSFMDAFVNFEYVDGDDGDIDSTGHYNFKYVPQKFGSLGFNVPVGDFAVGGVTNYYDSTKGPFADIPAQLSWGAHIRHRGTWSGYAVSQYLSYKHGGEPNAYPEFTRRNSTALSPVNEVPSGYVPTLSYTVRATF